MVISPYLQDMNSLKKIFITLTLKHVGKKEMFGGLIQQAVNNHVLFDYVLADSWFGSKANMAFIHEHLEKCFIARLALQAFCRYGASHAFSWSCF